MRKVSEIIGASSALSGVRALLWVVSGLPAWALDPSLLIHQYLHFSWTYRQGFSLSSVEAIAQTQDGYLWLGTTTGLVRFDGLRFTSWSAASGELPGQEIRALCAARDGSLWIGTSAGLAKWYQGRLRIYGPADGFTAGDVNAIAEDEAGRIWVGGSHLSVIRNDSAKMLALEEGVAVLALLADVAGPAWVGTSRGLCWWEPGGKHWCLPPSVAEPFSLARSLEGDLLIGDRLSKGILKLDRGSLRPVPWGTGDHSLNIRTLARDRNGNVWMGTLGKGLLRLRGNKLEAITRAEGLSSNFINTIFEDRQGGLWLGTPEGLDRLRDPTITRFSTTEGVSSELVTSVAAAKDGSVWLGTSGGGLNRMDGRGISILRKEDGMPSNSILSLFEDRDQSLWAGTTGGLIRRTGRSLVSVKAADGSPLNRVFAIAAAPNGEIWLLNGSNGLFRQSPRGFDAASIPGLHGSSGLFQIQFDPSGALWLGFYRGEIVQVRDGRVQWRGSPDARDVVLRALYADQAGILWVGTSRGLSRLRGGRWTNWTPQHGLPEGGVISILDDAAGGLWLVTPDRLLRVRGASLEAAADGSPRNLDLSVFGLGEGIRFGANGMMANPRVSRSSDGKLWIATEDGVAMLDPAKIGNRAAIQFAVMIEQMSVDGRVLDPSRAADLSFRGRQVQFDYTAPNLIDSERTVYRYRLDGFDRDWVDAGPLRSINYTNLAAGPYRFLVTASDGTVPYSSSSPTAAVSFYVQQVFYKTSWFFALCALALLLAGWAAQRLRDRRRRERFELVLAERTRVARDLHDTILQGFAGVMFQLDVVSRHIEHAPALAREKLNRAIEHADQSLQDARLALSYMRMRAVENSTLFEAVSVAGKELADNAVSFHATLKGEPYELPIHVQANFYALAREAMTNAVNHGRPEELRLELIYSGTTVILRVSDNGTGFDPKSPSTSKDHFGLSAMKERAEQIGGTFTLTSEIGRGTQVEIVLRRRLGPSWTS